jgi:mono/diheme cytochrome c family protein
VLSWNGLPRSRGPTTLCIRQAVASKETRDVGKDDMLEKTAMKRSLLALSTIALLWSTYAHARYAERQHGKEMLQKLCAGCHSVGRTGASPNRLAPPFRSFSETKLYDSDFKQRLQDGLTSIHPFMPTFRFNRENAEEALNYMKSIQEPPKPK